MEKINFNDFDKLNLFVKKCKRQEVVSAYTALGWALLDEKENNRYEDIIDLTFLRAHRIENKDELQLMQVYMEDSLNDIAKLERNKHSKTTGLGLFLGAVSLLFLFAGIYLIIKSQLIALSIICIIVGISSIILESIYLTKLFKSENLTFGTKVKQLNNNIKDICTKADTLLGGKNENK